MTERHSVWGTISDPDGRPVGTADVFWVDAAHAGKATVGLFDAHRVAQADVHGRFWAPGLPAGPGILVPDFQRICVVGDQFQIAHGTSVALPMDKEPALTFPHRRTEFGRVAGVVTDDVDGRPATRTPVAVSRR